MAAVEGAPSQQDHPFPLAAGAPADGEAAPLQAGAEAFHHHQRVAAVEAHPLGVAREVGLFDHHLRP